LQGCGGGITPNYFRVNLDREPVTVEAITGAEAGVGLLPPVPLPHKVSQAEPEVWYVQPITTNCTCSWVGYIEWTSDGTSGTTEFSDDGQPFRTASPVKATAVTDSFAGGWSPVTIPQEKEWIAGGNAVNVGTAH